VCGRPAHRRERLHPSSQIERRPGRFVPRLVSGDHHREFMRVVVSLALFYAVIRFLLGGLITRYQSDLRRLPSSSAASRSHRLQGRRNGPSSDVLLIS
jgi:hypothetical protein